MVLTSTLQMSRTLSMSYISNPISIVQFNQFKFMIMDAPTDQNLLNYVNELEAKKCKVVVRTCLPTYRSERLLSRGIQVVEFPFPDGEAPSKEIINAWLNIVQKEVVESKSMIAVHCVAGLGRSPLLVAIALIEFALLSATQCIELIRKVRKGAFNKKQCSFLLSYKPRRQNCCTIL